MDEAEKSGSGFVLQFDGNLWAGDKIIPGDPRPQNRIEQFLIRNPRLTVVNSLPECQGLVTRSRIKDGVKEESVLDFFIVCSRLLQFVTKMVIDDSKSHILTNYKSAKHTGRAVDSDHYTEYLDLALNITKETPERLEIFNFKDKNAQEAFKTITSETEEFTDCFNGEDDLIEKIEKWRIVLESHCSAVFKKIRIKDKKVKPVSKKLSNLINKRNNLVKIGCNCGKKFRTESNQQEHLKNYTEKNSQCTKCDKMFKTTATLIAHTTKHNEDIYNLCTKCGKNLKSQENLNIHKMNHTGTENYSCEPVSYTHLTLPTILLV